MCLLACSTNYYAQWINIGVGSATACSVKCVRTSATYSSSAGRRSGDAAQSLACTLDALRVVVDRRRPAAGCSGADALAASVSLGQADTSTLTTDIFSERLRRVQLDDGLPGCDNTRCTIVTRI